MSDKGGLHYIHARIDQLVRQTALEIGLIRLHTGIDPRAREDDAMELTRRRFWIAQDAAAVEHDQQKRER